MATLIWNDRWIFRMSQNVSDLKPAGKLEAVQSDVRRRLSGDIVWFGLDSRETVFFGDGLFTGEDSSASISFRSGFSVEMAPFSLIAISEENGESVLSIDSGTVVANLPQDSTLRLKIRGTEPVLKTKDGARVRIERNQAWSTEFFVESGAAELAAKPQIFSKSLPLATGESVTWKADRQETSNVTTRPVRLLSPPTGLQPAPLNAYQEVVLRWEPTSPLPPTQAMFRIQVARNAHFTKPLLDTISQATDVAFRPDSIRTRQNSYTWRVGVPSAAEGASGKSNEWRWSETGTFFVSQFEKNPNLKRPSPPQAETAPTTAKTAPRPKPLPPKAVAAKPQPVTPAKPQTPKVPMAKPAPAPRAPAAEIKPQPKPQPKPQAKPRPQVPAIDPSKEMIFAP